MTEMTENFLMSFLLNQQVNYPILNSHFKIELSVVFDSYLGERLTFLP